MLKKLGLSILDFLLFSNFFIAICAVAQGLVTYHLLGAKPSEHVLAFLFFSTLLIYNLAVLLAKPKEPQKSPFKRVRWIFAHHRLTISTTLISVLCLIPLGLLYLSFESKLLMIFVGLLAIAYNIPFLTLNNKKIGLRNIPGIKLFLIAFVWASSCVLLPIVELESMHQIQVPLSETVLLLAKRFLFVCAITVPFDIRDLFQDKLYELKTIPVVLGEKKAWIFCQALLGIYLLLLVLFTKGINIDVIGLTLTVILTGWLIFKSNIKRNEYFYFFYLDGTMLLQYAILVLCSWMSVALA
ncbi:UbiA family prenyltransferase [Pedobacter xixiisoli]|uniref:UbiA prenyltransferase family protein n=1 Tax=Pedobacter xixiisoli TaxID=1476464 RepID=A0A286AEZ6_9SPHI|nr:UbiA family prenyltransferase [Pedobacter xixiisoli]SOD20469.1 UbiA prenyltransferase family protein [Pedobacter xixiisoli]